MRKKIFIFIMLCLSTTAFANKKVLVHLFEWRWPDVAKECETFLGPHGFFGVQISPPNEHRIVSGRPWWERYQPVSFELVSRSGTRAEFIDMVARCNLAGVKIYADAVINHMASLKFQDDPTYGFGTAGSVFDYYAYPVFFKESDFHTCKEDIQDYQNRWRVQNCNLCGLADLNTGSPSVQTHIAAYLSELISLGVAGFRIDAAKHIDATELKAILSKVKGSFDFYQEVIETAPEPIQGAEYLVNGKVSEFDYGKKISQVFLQGKLSDLKNFTKEDPLFLPSEMAIVFIDNHDNQRGHGNGASVLTHKNKELYQLATAFMLAWPYGTPLLMSSYAFDNTDSGPPYSQGASSFVHEGGQVNCFGEWQCEHRFLPIANMVAFKNQTEGLPVLDWWDNGNNQIAFSRGDKGFFAINRENYPLKATLSTHLPEGIYCNLWNEESSQLPCKHESILVDSDHKVSVLIPPLQGLILKGEN